MNPIVEKWLQEQKEAQSASKRANKEKHLISLLYKSDAADE